MGNYDKSSRKKTSGVIVMAFLLILIIAILLAFLATMVKPNQESPKDQMSMNIEHTFIGKIENETVYDL